MTGTAPATSLARIQAFKTAWKALASTASFAGMTYTDFESAVKSSFDSRDAVRDAEAALTNAQDERDANDLTNLKLCDAVVKSVVADPKYGDDSALYEALGYIRKSERKTGLTRKKSPPKSSPGGTKP